MEFHEKLQELRKKRGLTQEELAAELYVSRTAVSKWESGRGYPGIDSLKMISAFFSVSIDELLSGDKIISIAERENRSGIQRICDMLIGITDLLSFALIFLPLYPKTVAGHIYSVNLLSYCETSLLNIRVYSLMFSALILLGVLKILLTAVGLERGRRALTLSSLALGLAAVFYLAMARESYAACAAIFLLVIKAGLFYRRGKAGK